MLFLEERIGKLLSELERYIISNEISLQEYEAAGLSEPIHDITDDSLRWHKVSGSVRCGGEGKYDYYRTRFTVPEEMAGEVMIYWWKTHRGTRQDTTNPQCCCYINGQFVQGLDDNHERIILTDHAVPGTEYEICLRVYTGQEYFWSSLDSSIAVLETETEKLYYDLKVPYEAARLLKKEDDYITIIRGLNDAVNLLDFRQGYSEEFRQSVREAERYIQEEFYQKKCHNNGPVVYCVGHTHIDIAWLWTIKVAKDKAVRSFGTVIEFMKRYPEYKFMSSQPHLYKAIKEMQPDLYEEIKERIRSGQWEAEGGMFVEADCNLPNGESLIRQIVKGKQFFRREFGVDNKVLWLPDVFGYSAALPQIMKECGLKYFMTTKISWNEMNKMPYDSFRWKGIDGTEVLTHFIPSSDYDRLQVSDNRFTTYNAMLEPKQVKGAWSRYQQKDKNQEVLMAYGFGDGGGGPTKNMLEHQRRLEKGIPGCPVTKTATSREFFEKLEEAGTKAKFPRWDGELYLEYHRGTYTSMGRNKKFNRKAEVLLQNLELTGFTTKLLMGSTYPKKELEGLWETLLRNQFHDILPGSSILEVYQDSKKEYDGLFAEGRKLLKERLEQVTEAVRVPAGSVIVYNMNGFRSSGYAVVVAEENLEGCYILDEEQSYPLQKVGDMEYLVKADEIPAMGYKAFQLVRDKKAPENQVSVSRECLENRYIRILFNEKGYMVSIYDKQADREILQKDRPGNVLMTYEDIPHNWDAWDINNYYMEKSWEIGDVSEIQIEEGVHRCGIVIKRNYLQSTIVQRIYLYQDSPVVEVKNEIDWKESHLLLKALFPVDIHSSEATFDIQYGNVKRPTHYNTSWDYAKFEVCHHKWVDLSEDDYGVSIINDCKYGCNVHEGIIGLSLIKSATSPNPEADKEYHEFTYGIYPHRGDWKKAYVAKEAYQLNNPLFGCVKETEGGSLPGNYGICSVDADNVMVELVKEPEDGQENAVIIRLYEYFNRRTRVKLRFSHPVAEAVDCNMLEEKKACLEITDNEVIFEIMPYEIKTIRIIKE
ncbi:alpha-mannosidase [Anaerotaenia torta]|uniref:alpha-mannosidase n=1 Tax=Anaerotaenia torta TaxID=433293 RepID=UPI003D1F34BC